MTPVRGLDGKIQIPQSAIDSVNTNKVGLKGIMKYFLWETALFFSSKFTDGHIDSLLLKIIIGILSTFILWGLNWLTYTTEYLLIFLPFSISETLNICAWNYRNRRSKGP